MSGSRSHSTATATAVTYELRSLENLSPKEEEEHYVAVVTPVNSAAAVSSSGSTDASSGSYDAAYRSLDSNGIPTHEWASTFRTRGDLSTPYFWFACCCPCIAVPQLEVRMGVSSFRCAALSFAASQLMLIGLWLLLVAALWSHVRGGRGASIQWILLLIAFGAAQTMAIASRIASLRSKVRARFAIPGTGKDDLRLAVLHPTQTVLQMATHLACDRVRPCSVPTTLPAYEV